MHMSEYGPARTNHGYTFTTPKGGYLKNSLGTGYCPMNTENNGGTKENFHLESDVQHETDILDDGAS